MTDDISAIAARLREAIDERRLMGDEIREDYELTALLDDWERRGKERDEALEKHDDMEMSWGALTARIDAAEARTQDAFGSLRQCQDDHRARVAELERERDEAVAGWTECLQTLTARVAELTEALEPFADYGDDDDGVVIGIAGDFRRARAVLAKGEG